MKVFVLIAAMTAGPVLARPLAGLDPVATHPLAELDPVATHPLADFEPARLAAFEELGLRFDRRVDSASYEVLRQRLQEDLARQDQRVAAFQGDYTGKVTPFKPLWLTRDLARWTLVAVVERPDRALLASETCGETRAVYRLRIIDKHQVDTALPALVSLVTTWPKTKDCAVFWRTRLARDFVASELARAGWHRLEVNLQSSRWADDGKGRFLDQVRYLMRVFKRDALGKLAVSPLENTPDVELLRRDARLKKELWSFVTGAKNHEALIRGRLLLPEKFLAYKAESVTPFGLERRANRPFATLFGDESGKDQDGLLRRLDAATCVGCHQSAAVAGFHVLGKERGPATDLLVPFSPHFEAIQAWRKHPVGEVPDPESVAYPRRAPLRGNLPIPARDGDACEAATLATHWRAEQDTLTEVTLATCPQGGVCASTTNGFPGGLCSSDCRGESDSLTCQAVPVLGPFSTCREAGGSFETCLARHHRATGLAACRRPADCRVDYACIAKGPDRGYCAPAYVLPQLNVEHH